MVRAILSGQKTQTRREFKALNGGIWPNKNDIPGMKQILRNSKYGQPGDRLWVRETFADLIGSGIEHRPTPSSPIQRFAYAADTTPGSYSDECRKDYGIKWTPSIHMPRSACRILLEVTGVRVERLNDISEEDAKAEGAMYHDGRGIGHSGWRHDYKDVHANARSSFVRLWEEINGVESWESNPWVWVVEFKRVTP